jgi:hypothetical protein
MIQLTRPTSRSAMPFSHPWIAKVLSVYRELVSTRWSSPLPQHASGHKRLPLGQRGQATVLVSLSVDKVAF